MRGVVQDKYKNDKKSFVFNEITQNEELYDGYNDKIDTVEDKNF